MKMRWVEYLIVCILFHHKFMLLFYSSLCIFSALCVLIFFSRQTRKFISWDKIFYLIIFMAFRFFFFFFGTGRDGNLEWKALKMKMEHQNKRRVISINKFCSIKQPSFSGLVSSRLNLRMSSLRNFFTKLYHSEVLAFKITGSTCLFRNS